MTDTEEKLKKNLNYQKQMKFCVSCDNSKYIEGFLKCILPGRMNFKLENFSVELQGVCRGWKRIIQ